MSRKGSSDSGNMRARNNSCILPAKSLLGVGARSMGSTGYEHFEAELVAALGGNGRDLAIS